MPTAQPLSRTKVEEISARHGVSTGAVEALVAAMEHSQGRAAQFSHPDLGGMGQWMAGGMLYAREVANSRPAGKARSSGRNGWL